MNRILLLIGCVLIAFTVVSAVPVAENVSEGGEQKVSDAKEKCIQESAAHLNQVTIEEPVHLLVKKSREYYATFDDLFKADDLSNYMEGLESIGSQEGCDKIIEHVVALKQKVPCFQELDENAMKAIASEGNAGLVMEARYACAFSVREPFKYALKEAENANSVEV